MSERPPLPFRSPRRLHSVNYQSLQPYVATIAHTVYFVDASRVAGREAERTAALAGDNAAADNEEVLVIGDLQHPGYLDMPGAGALGQQRRQLQVRTAASEVLMSVCFET